MPDKDRKRSLSDFVRPVGEEAVRDAPRDPISYEDWQKMKRSGKPVKRKHDFQAKSGSNNSGA